MGSAFVSLSTNPRAPFNVMGGNNAGNRNSGQLEPGGPDGRLAQAWNLRLHNWFAFVEYNYLDFGTKAANSTHLLSLPNYDRGPETST